MPDDAEALATAWTTNCRINRMILEAIPEDDLACTLSKRGGRGVAGEFAHMHNIRLAHLEKRAKDLAVDLPKLATGDPFTTQELLDAFDTSDPAIETFLTDAATGVPKRRAFKRGLFTTLSYFVSHEAHHRGRILLTLKVSGRTLDKTTQMGIWAWDNI